MIIISVLTVLFDYKINESKEDYVLNVSFVAVQLWLEPYHREETLWSGYNKVD